MKEVSTTCPYCGVGCGVIARTQPDGRVDISGDASHPANYGRLCTKGAALGETLSLEDRLLTPRLHGRAVSWDIALDHVAKAFRETVEQHGPDSIALYVSGQILTEDYYVANKFMKGFIGSANIDTNSRLCMASSVAGHRRAFGSDTVPGTYADLELAEVVVIVGSNLAWCHPVLAQRLAEARDQRGVKIVVVDPRTTASCDIADLHLPILPGTDVALFSGLLSYLATNGWLNDEFVQKHTVGADATINVAAQISFAEVAAITGLAPSDLRLFYELFAEHRRVVTVYSQGVNQSTAGTDKVSAIINCHLATGRIGHPGMGPFSVTGQPNAMGGREVGGLANMLAAHMELGDSEHSRIVQSFWRAPNLAQAPGYKAVELFEAVADGSVKAVWIMGTNPVVSMPDADAVKAALLACPMVVVSDVVARTDTTECADILLPSLAWGEKSGTVTNSERMISRQRRFLPAPGEARSDWRQIAEVASRMGFGDAFAWRDEAEIFAEHAGLSGHENNGARDFDISAYETISKADYHEMAPFRWPQPRKSGVARERFFGDGRFYTPDAKARFVPVSHKLPASSVSGEFPLVLNTGRIRDQWHTMTRTEKAARLMAHIAEPFLEIHPDDARSVGVRNAEIALVRSVRGEALLRIHVSARQRRGSVFAPMHWTTSHSGRARIDALVAPNVDAISGQPELKYTPVEVRPAETAWHGFAVSAQRPSVAGFEYWSVARTRTGWASEFAGARLQVDWTVLAETVLGGAGSVGLLVYRDQASGQHRFAAFEGDVLRGLLFISRKPVDASRAWAASVIGSTVEAPVERLHLLAGRAGAGKRSAGPTICICYDVGAADIVDAIASGCDSVSAIGESLRAGTNCGSCRGDISRLLEARVREDA